MSYVQFLNTLKVVPIEICPSQGDPVHTYMAIFKNQAFFSGVRPFFHIFRMQTDFMVKKLELLENFFQGENLENLKLCVNTGNCNGSSVAMLIKKKMGVLWCCGVLPLPPPFLHTV